MTHKSNSPLEGRRCGIYARSVRSNAHQLNEQIESCRSFIRSRGWTVVEALIITERGPGDRVGGRIPGLQTLIEAVKGNPRPLDCLVVTELHRLNRKTSETRRIVDELAYHGVSIRAVYNHTDTSGLGFEDWRKSLSLTTRWPATQPLHPESKKPPQ